MADWQMLSVWGFGVACGVIMLGTLARRRREALVKSLREHVAGSLGKPTAEDQETAAPPQ
jgi:hypothetical protein